jgi:hypothetical protein
MLHGSKRTLVLTAIGLAVAESRAQEAAATERGGNAKSESMDREAGLIEVRAEEYAYGIMCGEWSSE